MISEQTLSTCLADNQKFEDADISEMFDFKYKEDVEKCFSLLRINGLPSEDTSTIDIKSTDGSLDEKILFPVSLETRQRRYRTQVVTSFVNEEQSERIRAYGDKGSDRKLLRAGAV